MFERVLQQLEDPGRPYLGPVIKYLSFCGFWISDNFKKNCFSIMIHVLQTIFIITEFIDVFYIRHDLVLLLTNFKYSMQGAINVCKAWSLIFWQREWRKICDYVTETDLNNRSSSDPKTERNITQYTRYTRKLTYTYTIFTYITGFAVITQPAMKYLLSPKYREDMRLGTQDYMQVISSWTPFDKTKLPGYCLAYVVQSYGAVVACIWVTSYDVIALSVMIFVRAELESLRIDCAKIFNVVSESNILERIKNIHKRHAKLLICCRSYNACTSPIQMIYLFVCTGMLCATAYQINMEANKMQKIMALIYLLFVIFELFLYCWHSNDVYYASMSLPRGPYESEWWSQKASHQKEMYILGGQLSKRIIFTAGPFTDLTVATFINILKGAYSYYTLL